MPKNTPGNKTVNRANQRWFCTILALKATVTFSTNYNRATVTEAVNAAPSMRLKSIEPALNAPAM